MFICLDALRHSTGRNTVTTLLLCVVVQSNATADPSTSRGPRGELPNVFSDVEWQSLDESVDRGLVYLSRQSRAGGSFRAGKVEAQPAVTALAIMAFLSDGHIPGEGPYGQQLTKAVDYTLSCQNADGLFSAVPIGNWVKYNAAHCASYNHAITSLMLTEIYGMADREQSDRIEPAIRTAIAYSLKLQARPKDRDIDRSGWRYPVDQPIAPWMDSDLSITTWNLMFLRSAKTAGFDVPSSIIDNAVAYVQRCRVKKPGFEHRGLFSYAADVPKFGDCFNANLTMTAAAVVSLSVTGHHDHPVLETIGDWLMDHPFSEQSKSYPSYACFYCSQAAAQLGGEVWRRTYPPIVTTLLQQQQTDGSWHSSGVEARAGCGPTYATAMAVLSLTTSYQLLPIYQR